MQSIARDSDESSDDEFFDAHGRQQAPQQLGKGSLYWAGPGDSVGHGAGTQRRRTYHSGWSPQAWVCGHPNQKSEGAAGQTGACLNPPQEELFFHM